MNWAVMCGGVATGKMKMIEGPSREWARKAKKSVAAVGFTNPIIMRRDKWFDDIWTEAR